MSEQAPQVSEAEILQMLVTEHTSLQAVRSATVFDSNGRTNLFLTTVSSAVVALAFIGQASGMNETFLLFALILLPSLMFIGWVTLIRVNQSGLEDMISSRGINRIRHYYTEVAPHMKPYFIHSTHDDMNGMFQNMGIQPSFWQQFASTAGLVNVINSILTAVFVGLSCFVLFNAALLVCVVASAVTFVASVAVGMWYQHVRYLATERQLTILFPTENSDQQ